LTNPLFRIAIATGCILGGIYIHLTGSIPLAPGVFLWLLLAAGAGYMIPTGWLLLVAPVPWIVGIGGGALIGQHDAFTELWYVPLLLSTFSGAVGITFGVSAHKNKTRSRRENEAR
jgi:hypothetical protein